jgi:hypothetical protein
LAGGSSDLEAASWTDERSDLEVESWTRESSELEAAIWTGAASWRVSSATTYGMAAGCPSAMGNRRSNSGGRRRSSGGRRQTAWELPSTGISTYYLNLRSTLEKN